MYLTSILITMTIFLLSKQYKRLIYLTQRGTETVNDSAFVLGIGHKRNSHDSYGKLW